MPKSAVVEKSVTVRESRSANPMPTAPMKKAVSLLRTTATNTFKACTPPKMPVYLKMCR